MASYEVRLLIEDFETQRSPEVLIDFFEDEDLTYWARLGSSNADNEFDEILESDDSYSKGAPDEDTLFNLANTFVRSLS